MTSRVSGSIVMGPPRAFPGHALGCSNEGLAVGFSTRFPEDLIDEMHAVVAGDGEEVRPHTLIGELHPFHEGLVLCRVMSRRIEIRGHNAQGAVAHAVEKIIIREIA